MAAQSLSGDPRAERVATALQNVEITSLDIWPDLDDLSTHTQVDAIDVPVEGVVIDDDGRFSAILNLYLVLQYGRGDEEGFSQSESFLAKVSGHLDDGVPLIDQSSVDTSSFYE